MSTMVHYMEIWLPKSPTIGDGGDNKSDTLFDIAIIQIFNNTNFSNFTAAIYKCSKIYNVINK